MPRVGRRDTRAPTHPARLGLPAAHWPLACLCLRSALCALRRACADDAPTPPESGVSDQDRWFQVFSAVRLPEWDPAVVERHADVDVRSRDYSVIRMVVSPRALAHTCRRSVGRVPSSRCRLCTSPSPGQTMAFPHFNGMSAKWQSYWIVVSRRGTLCQAICRRVPLRPGCPCLCMVRV